MYDDIYDFEENIESQLEKNTVQKRQQVRMTAMKSTNIDSRPITAIAGAGYKSAYQTTHAGQKKKLNTITQLERKEDSESLDVKIRKQELQIEALVLDSCYANEQRNHQQALEKAKEAVRHEKQLQRLSEQDSTYEYPNIDISFSVNLNLALQLTHSGDYNEALSVYSNIVRDKKYNSAGRLRVNMGNIYFMMKDYRNAIKMYRMALDQIPKNHRQLRKRIMINIGISFMTIEQLTEAISTFEHIILEKKDLQASFNLLICYYLMEDKDGMKIAFQQLLSFYKPNDSDKYSSYFTNGNKKLELLLDIIKNDELSKYETACQQRDITSIKRSAKLISNVIEREFEIGYNWCIDQTKMSSNSKRLVNELVIDTSLLHLKKNNIQKAIDILKSFHKSDAKSSGTASCNLSFIYFLKGEFEEAEKYANFALEADELNPNILVNKGNCYFANNDHEMALKYYNSAQELDPSSIGALFNMIILYKIKNDYNKAIEYAFKLRGILPNDPQVYYHIADIYYKVQDYDHALDWFIQLVGIVPNDASVLEKLGEIHEARGDRAHAFQYYSDAYKCYPANSKVVQWLGNFFIDSQLPERAVVYFETALRINPKEMHWYLCLSNCYRQMGNHQQAYSLLKIAHEKFPNNIECLTNIIEIAKNVDLTEVAEYSNRLEKIYREKQRRRDSMSANKLQRHSAPTEEDLSSSNRGQSGNEKRLDHTASHSDSIELEFNRSYKEKSDEKSDDDLHVLLP